MPAICWMTVIAICTVLNLANTSHTLAASTQQTKPPLEITIAATQAEATTGAPMTWHVTLTPRVQQSVGSIELRSGDAQAWAWLDNALTIETLTSTRVLNVSAIPLVNGDLKPILEAHYTVGEEKHEQLIVGDVPVHVELVEARVEVGVIVIQRTAREGGCLPVELWIRNGSPFTLTQVLVSGNGADLTWEAPIALEDILPGQNPRQVFTPTVEGQHPQPQLSIKYAWTDVVGIPYSQTLYVSGDLVALEENIVGKVPNELLGIIVGVITGALATLIPKWIEERRSQKRQKEINRENVYGLLRLAVLQSEHAADNGVETSLVLLETIFKEEGLFAIVKEDKLAHNVHDLWKMAERHNTGLSLPGGAQRSKELYEAAQKLIEKLDTLEATKQDG
jgi:hypothetical protein